MLWRLILTNHLSELIRNRKRSLETGLKSELPNYSKTTNDDLIEPIQLENLQPKTAKSGRTVNFVCSVVAGKVAEFLWTKQGQLIKDDAKFRVNIEPEASMLLIRNVDLNDAGDYTCVAKNAFSEDRVSTSLRVEGNRQELMGTPFRTLCGSPVLPSEKLIVLRICAQVDVNCMLVQAIKDRTECFDRLHQCRLNNSVKKIARKLGLRSN